MRNPQRAWYHPLHISDPTLCLICIYGRINKTDHITILFFFTYHDDDQKSRPPKLSRELMMIVITYPRAIASAVKWDSISLWLQAQAGLELHSITGKTITSDTHQSSQTGCNCCWIKQSQAEERFTNSHTKIDKRSMLRKSFWLLLVSDCFSMVINRKEESWNTNKIQYKFKFVSSICNFLSVSSQH